jgi:hypothetical protein
MTGHEALVHPSVRCCTWFVNLEDEKHGGHDFEYCDNSTAVSLPKG